MIILILSMRNKIVTAVYVLAIVALFMLSGCAEEKPIGGETDEHGCMLMAGYQWCPSKEKCLRAWDEYCAEYADQYKGGLTEEEARAAAEGTECIDTGILTENAFHNLDTGTWWIDLDMKEEFEKPGCNPACVIFEKTGEVEINWRCTGLIPE